MLQGTGKVNGKAPKYWSGIDGYTWLEGTHMDNYGYLHIYIYISTYHKHAAYLFGFWEVGALVNPTNTAFEQAAQFKHLNSRNLGQKP